MLVWNAMRFLESLYIRRAEWPFFFFKRKSTKSIQNKPCSLCSLQVVYIFLLKSTISPVTGLKNGVEVALYCSTKKKKKTLFQSDANRETFTIIYLVKFTLHFKLLALQILFNPRQICRLMEKRNRLLYILYTYYINFTFMSQM